MKKFIFLPVFVFFSILSGSFHSVSVSAQSFSTYQQFRKAVTSNFPDAKPSQQQFNNFNKFARSHGGISTKQEAAMALAQFIHESWGLRLKRECVPGKWPCVPCRNGNSQCGNYKQSCDIPGKKYFGRGYIHLTWSCDNYAPASQALFGDRNVLLKNPDRVSDDDSVAWRTAFWYWKSRVHNYPGVKQGKFGASTKAINGGLECGPNPVNREGAQTRYRYYKNVRKAWGLKGDGNPAGCR